jgi:hypothetical protein
VAIAATTTEREINRMDKIFRINHPEHPVHPVKYPLRKDESAVEL